MGTLLTIAPKYTRAYLMRGEVSLKQNDTIQALRDFDKAIDMDRYDPDGWGARAIVRLQQGKYKEAEADLDQSIHLSAKNAGNYINRALARFHQNNWRGAMSDYDLALDVYKRQSLWRVTWSLGGNFYWPRFKTQFTLKAEQYLLKEKGIKFDMIRHFRYCSIGFYAMTAEHAKANGGFRFQVALPCLLYTSQ